MVNENVMNCNSHCWASTQFGGLEVLVPHGVSKNQTRIVTVKKILRVIIINNNIMVWDNSTDLLPLNI
jgi:hypothetical protein